MERENSLDADSIRNLAHRESRAVTAAIYFDHDAFKRLDAFLFAFDHLHLQANRITDAELRNILAQFALFKLADDCIHGLFPKTRQLTYRNRLGDSISRIPPSQTKCVQ